MGLETGSARAFDTEQVEDVMRNRIGNILKAHDGKRPGAMRVLLTATDNYEALTIRSPFAYLVSGYAEDAAAVACPANLPKLTIADLVYEVQQAAAGDGKGFTEVTGKRGPHWKTTKKRSASAARQMAKTRSHSERGLCSTTPGKTSSRMPSGRCHRRQTSADTPTGFLSRRSPGPPRP